MARPAMAGLTISRLESMLNQQRTKKKDLLKERTRLQSQLEKLDRQIAALDGAGGVSSSGRARNTLSLVATLESVLEKQPKGMSVSAILEAVQAAGYKSSSPNFRGIINQTLIKERKKFNAISRGVYAIKK
jgi:septal ring factor EnvC (AmiA/AmiB activator)